MDIDISNDDTSAIWSKPSVNVTNTSGGDGDVWDDTELVRAYDKAIAQLKEESDMTSSSNQIQLPSGKIRKRKSKKRKNIKKWRVGEPCLAMSEEDGLFYEASVLSANNDNHRAIVTFLDGDEEHVTFEKLLPLHNKYRMCVVTNRNEDDGEEDDGDEDDGDEDDGVKNWLSVPSDRNEDEILLSKDKNDVAHTEDWNVSDICYIVDNKTGGCCQAVINSFTSSQVCLVTLIKSKQKREVNISQLRETHPNQEIPHLNEEIPHPEQEIPHERLSSNPPDFRSFHPSLRMPPPPPPLLNFPEFLSHSYNNESNPFKDIFSENRNEDLCAPGFSGFSDDVSPVTKKPLSDMLMSWYMSGYHTGYYQGLQQNDRLLHGKHRNRKRHNRGRRQVYQ